MKWCAEKFHVTPRDVYHHFETMQEWLTDYIEVSKAKTGYYQFLMRLEYLYREAVWKYQHAKTEAAEMFYFNRMLELTLKKQDLIDYEDPAENETLRLLLNRTGQNRTPSQTEQKPTLTDDSFFDDDEHFPGLGHLDQTEPKLVKTGENHEANENDKK